MSCGVCEAANTPLVCDQCFAGSPCLSDKRSLLEQRDAAAQQLKAVLADKVAHQQQQRQLLHLAEELRATRQHAAEVDRQLQVERRGILAGHQQQQQRQLRLREVQQDLDALSRQMEALTAPHRNQKVQACVRSLEALAREQRTKVVSRAMEILPLKLVPLTCPVASNSGSRSSLGAAAQRDCAAVCSLVLPDKPVGMTELAQLAGSLGSALGYLALLLDLLSRFLQLPVAHRAAFQGSTSRLWQPDGFFDMRPLPPNDALRLSWPAAADGGRSGLGLSALGGGGSAAATQQQQRRMEQQLQAALHELQRSAGLLVYARLGPEAAFKVPEDRLPFTWLAKLCKLLALEPRSSTGRVAVPRAGPLHASAVLGRSSLLAGSASSSQSVWLGQVDLDCPTLLTSEGPTTYEAPEEDWEHLPRPAYGMMPPRPWELEDVEHWEQANFADGGGAGGGGIGGSTVSYGSSPIAALHAWFTNRTRMYLGTAQPTGS